MKKVIFALLAALLLASPAFASVAVSEDGTYEGEATRINLSTGLNGTLSGSKYTITADPVDITSAVFEGTTADAFETTLAVVDPTADQTVTLPNDTGYVMISTLATNTTTAANSVTGASNALVFEGSAADGFETSVSATNPTADRTITLPDAGGTVPISQASYTASKIYVATDTGLDSGDTSEATPITGVTSASKCFATITNDPTTDRNVLMVVAGTDTVTTTISGDPGASGADLAILCID